MVKKTMNRISKALGQHYSEKFSRHGPSPEGVDWGADESKMLLRYDKMLGVADWVAANKPSLLDVGCGYGGLRQYAIRGVIGEYLGRVYDEVRARRLYVISSRTGFSEKQNMGEGIKAAAKSNFSD